MFDKRGILTHWKIVNNLTNGIGTSFSTGGKCKTTHLRSIYVNKIQRKKILQYKI